MKKYIALLILISCFFSTTYSQDHYKSLSENMINCLQNNNNLDMNNQSHIRIIKRINQVCNLVVQTDILKDFIESDTIYFIESYCEGFVDGRVWNENNKIIEFHSNPNKPDIVSFYNENTFSKELISLVSKWDINEILKKKESEIIIIPTTYCYVTKITRFESTIKDISCIFFKLNM